MKREHGYSDERYVIHIPQESADILQWLKKIPSACTYYKQHQKRESDQHQTMPDLRHYDAGAHRISPYDQYVTEDHRKQTVQMERSVENIRIGDEIQYKQDHDHDQEIQICFFAV